MSCCRKRPHYRRMNTEAMVTVKVMMTITKHVPTLPKILPCFLYIILYVNPLGPCASVPLQHARPIPSSRPTNATVLQRSPRERINRTAKSPKLFAIPHVLNAYITEMAKVKPIDKPYPKIQIVTKACYRRISASFDALVGAILSIKEDMILDRSAKSTT